MHERHWEHLMVSESKEVLRMEGVAERTKEPT